MFAFPANPKIPAFEYFVKSIRDWHQQVYENHDSDLNRLKILKLLFFTTAASTEKDQEKSLLEVFNNFYALPFGHVESDVYQNIDNLSFFEISRKGITLKQNDLSSISSLVEKEHIRLIDEAIDALKGKNSDIITYSGLKLVDLSHEWLSWKLTFEEARKEGRNSKKIDPQLIKIEPKQYRIRT